MAQGAPGQGHGLLGLAHQGLPGFEGLLGYGQSGLQALGLGPGIPAAGGEFLQPSAQEFLLPAGILPALLLETLVRGQEAQPLIQGHDGPGPPVLLVVHLVQGQPQVLHLGGLLRDLGREGGDAALQGVQVLQDLLPGGFQFLGLAGQQDALGGLDGGVQIQSPPGLGGLALQGILLLDQLEKNIVQAQQVGPGVLQAALGVGPAQLVAGDPGGFFQQGAPVLGLGGEDEIDLPLLDEGVGPGAHAGIHEQVLDVLQTALPAVDAVIAARVPVEAPGDHHLPDGTGQGRVGHLQGQFHLGHAHGLALAGPGEDHIGHLRAAHQGGPLLAQHPGQGIRDVGFAAAVRPHHRGHPDGKGELLRVGKGFETMNF
jgi:hypothetical protein